MSRQPRVARVRSVILAVALIGGVAACASDGDSASDPTPADDSSTAQPAGGSDETDEGANAPSGAGTGTLTLADGTEFAFEMSTCDTSENSDAFVVADGYDISGRTADDAFRASFNRSGFDESTVSEISTLEGEFDEDGKNSELIYQDVTDTMALTVDGANVSGTLTMKPVGPNNPYGDETEATVDINC